MCLCLVCKSLKSSEPAGVQDSVLWIWRSHEGSLVFKAKGPSGVRPASCRVPRAALSPAGADLVCLHHLGLFRVSWVACPVGSCGQEERFSGGAFCKPDCCPRETPSESPSKRPASPARSSSSAPSSWWLSLATLYLASGRPSAEGLPLPAERLLLPLGKGALSPQWVLESWEEAQRGSSSSPFPSLPSCLASEQQWTAPLSASRMWGWLVRLKGKRKKPP